MILTAARSQVPQIFVEHYYRGHYDLEETMEHIFLAVTKVKQPIVDVLIEATSYQRALVQLIEMERRRRNLKFRVVPITPHRDKFTRVISLQPLWETGDILLKPGMTELIEESERFPKGDSDDILDALANQMLVPGGLIPQRRAQAYIPPRYRQQFMGRPDWQRLREQREKMYSGYR